MGKSLEMRRKKNLDAFDEIDEMNWDGKSSTSGRTQEELDSLKEMFESDWFKDVQEKSRAEDTTSYAMLKMLEESEKSDEELTELWGASDLGKYTINTPTPQKQAVAKSETQMQPVSELEFKEISEDLDKEDAEMQKKLEEAFLELEGIF